MDTPPAAGSFDAVFGLSNDDTSNATHAEKIAAVNPTQDPLTLANLALLNIDKGREVYGYTNEDMAAMFGMPDAAADCVIDMNQIALDGRLHSPARNVRAEVLRLLADPMAEATTRAAVTALTLLGLAGASTTQAHAILSPS